MKKSISVILILILLAGMTACAHKEPTVVRTYAADGEQGDSSVFVTYEELSDGTFRADGRIYAKRLTVTGRLSGASADISYTILTNLEDISFEEAWKAGGLSSDTRDYFAPEDAVFVGIGGAQRFLPQFPSKRLTSPMKKW